MRIKFYTPRQAAKYWGISTRTVQRMCRDRRIDHRRLGARYLIPESAVHELGQTEAVPQTRKTYTKNPQKAQQDYQELASRLHKQALEKTPNPDQDPSQSILTPREQLILKYQERIRQARHADEAWLLRQSLKKQLALLDEETRQADLKQQRKPVDPTRCQNPDMDW